MQKIKTSPTLMFFVGVLAWMLLFFACETILKFGGTWILPFQDWIVMPITTIAIHQISCNEKNWECTKLALQFFPLAPALYGVVFALIAFGIRKCTGRKARFTK